MKKLMQEEYEAFIRSYDEPHVQGLRVNTLKIKIEDFLSINPFHLHHIPWVNEGFYYDMEDRPGKHPFHEAGLYYIQEPSAMAVGALADVKPGERILDLAAAPGGKSTHIAAKLQGKGLLVSNEIHPSRAKILSQNVERMGIKNCVVTNEHPERLAKKFKNYFHKILVDAPCSGEGMFRKDIEACNQWSLDNVSFCSDRQLDILENASEMLMPEGILIYSTCTFSPEENEGVIEQFLKIHKEFIIEKSKSFEGFDHGRAAWINSKNTDLNKTIRLWPHKLRGEGHFIAVLRKIDGEEQTKVKRDKKSMNKQHIKDYMDFTKSYLQYTPEGEFLLFGDHLYIVPDEMISLENLKVLRPGWHLGMFKKNRFEPSHALALSLKSTEVKNSIFLDSSSSKILSYLKGESLETAGNKGWNLVLVNGYSLGWGKLSNHVLKNHYPKGLRWVDY
jgi:NOL1/NOP2/sun family putative RNA methylase